MDEYENFYDTIKDMDGVMRLTIEKKLASYMGLKKGDKVKVMIKRVNEVDVDEKCQ